MLNLDPARFTTKTERLILRPYKASDFGSWLQAIEDRLKKQSEFDPGPLAPKFRTETHYRKWLTGLAQVQEHDYVYMLGIFDKRTQANIGLVNFGVIARLSYQFANLGYEINNQFWGKGYATEATKAAIPLALKKLKLHRIEAGIEPHNKASIKVAERAGMIKEGLREKYYWNGKRWVDLVYYRALARTPNKPSVRTGYRDYLSQ